MQLAFQRRWDHPTWEQGHCISRPAHAELALLAAQSSPVIYLHTLGVGSCMNALANFRALRNLICPISTWYLYCSLTSGLLSSNRPVRAKSLTGSLSNNGRLGWSAPSEQVTGIVSAVGSGTLKLRCQYLLRLQSIWFEGPIFESKTQGIAA